MSAIPGGHKRCSKCGEVRGRAEMTDFCGEPNLVGFWCKSCHTAFVRQCDERLQEIERQYREFRPLMVKATRNNARARLYAAPGHHTAADLRLPVRAQTDKRG